MAPTLSIALSTLLRTQATPAYPLALGSFISSILTVPNLTTSTPSARLPSSALASLVGEKSAFPYYDIVAYISDNSAALLLRLASVQESGKISHAPVYLLANLVEMGRNRLSAAKDGKTVVSLLTALAAILAGVPTSLLAQDSAVDLKGKSKATAIDITVEDDGDIVMADALAPPSATARLDGQTYRSLSHLTSESFLSTVIALSTRYSASSRPALSNFLVTLLYSWPTKRESTINTLVYSGLVGAGKGLLREIWRGWVRSSPLARQLSEGRQTSTISTLQEPATVGGTSVGAVANEKYIADWPHFILLAELYARCLLTLGDDEFFAPPAPASGGAVTMARNPLTMDEVVGLSSLWRNLAFALYWQPEVLVGPGGMEAKVPGTRVTLEQLRKLGTTLLQAIHARE